MKLQPQNSGMYHRVAIQILSRYSSELISKLQTHPSLHSPVSVGPMAVIPNERVQIWCVCSYMAGIAPAWGYKSGCVWSVSFRPTQTGLWKFGWFWAGWIETCYGYRLDSFQNELHVQIQWQTPTSMMLNMRWHRPHGSKHTQICTLSLGMTALWPYSNGAVQIRVGLELAEMTITVTDPSFLFWISLEIS